MRRAVLFLQRLVLTLLSIFLALALVKKAKAQEVEAEFLPIGRVLVVVDIVPAQPVKLEVRTLPTEIDEVQQKRKNSLRLEEWDMLRRISDSAAQKAWRDVLRERQAKQTKRATMLERHRVILDSVWRDFFLERQTKPDTD